MTPGAPDDGTDVEPPTAGPTEVVRRRILAADGVLLATDFDGTLAGIRERPDAATLRSDARDALAALAGRPEVDVAVVSGRALADLRERVDVPGVAYAGNHGLEIETAGEEFVHPDAEAAVPALREARERLEERLADVDGAHVEDKTLTATVHFRRVDDEEAIDRVRSVTRAVVGDHDELVHGEGKAVLELRPAVEWDKGRAIEWLLDAVASSADPHPLYLGDDVTDEDAFEVLGDGTTVAVGREPSETAAEFVVDGPADVAALLAQVGDVLEADE